MSPKYEVFRRQDTTDDSMELFFDNWLSSQNTPPRRSPYAFKILLRTDLVRDFNDGNCPR
jgi:hypothetical protein